MMKKELADAIALVQSLRVGDRVQVTRDGRPLEMTVSDGPRRGDGGGAAGSRESLRITASLGPGRYSTTVSAEALANGYVSMVKL